MLGSAQGQPVHALSSTGQQQVLHSTQNYERRSQGGHVPNHMCSALESCGGNLAGGGGGVGGRGRCACVALHSVNRPVATNAFSPEAWQGEQLFVPPAELAAVANALQHGPASRKG